MSSGTAVVTGASSGIGAATARRLAQEGSTSWPAARRRDRLDALRDELGDRLRPVTLDVTSADSVAALAAEVGGELNVLVNNAGGAFGHGPGRRRRPGRLAGDVRGQRDRRAAGDPGPAAARSWRAARGTSS